MVVGSVVLCGLSRLLLLSLLVLCLVWVLAGLALPRRRCPRRRGRWCGGSA